MAAQVYYSPFIPAFSSNGAPVPGAKLYFYYTGTTDLAPVYLDSSMTTPSANPIQASLAGKFPDVYLNDAITYRVRQTTSTGTPLGADIDPYIPGSAYTVVASLPQLLAPDGSNIVGFLQAGTSAVARSLQSKGRDVISVRDFGATGDGTTDDTAAIQLAVDYANTLSTTDAVEVLFPKGEYKITPTASAPGYIGNYAFGATCKYGILMKSNVKFKGEGSILKVANGISGRGAPQNFAVFYTNQSVQNITFDGLTIDLNSANNYFSPAPTNTALPQEDTSGVPGRYLRYHQAAIFVEGSTGKGDDITIRNCTFKNGNGVSTIICARVGTPGAGRRWRIENCNFLELGLDTYDHSSIFLYCDDVWVTNCMWRNTALYAPTSASLAGVNSAVELHGSNTHCKNNTIDGANRGFFVTENGYSKVEAVQVSGNILRRIKYCGIDVAFDGSGGFGPARLVEVTDNIIDMTADDTNVAGTTVPTAIQYFGLDSVVAPIESLVIARNEMKRPASGSGRACQGIGLSIQAANFGMIDILDNGASGFTRGSYLVTDTTTTAESINYQRNRWRNPNGGTIPAVTKVGWFMLAQGGTIGRIAIGDGEITDTRSTNSWSLGIAVTKTVTTTVREFNVGRNAAFDTRLAFANRFSGITDLTMTTMYGVPVTVTYNDSGTLAANGGANSFSGALPGAGSVLGSRIEFVDITTFPAPNNPAWFYRKAYANAANTVTYHITNVLTSIAAPGVHTVAIYNYPSP